MEGDVITMQEIFLFEKVGVTQDGKVIGRFRATGVRPKCAERIKRRGHPPAARHVRRGDGGPVMRNLLPLVMFVVGAGTIVGAYALIAWLPGRLAQRRIESRIAGLAMPFPDGRTSPRPPRS